MIGGHEAVQLRIAEKYIEQFGNLAKTNNTMIVPSSVSDVAGFLATAMSIVQRGNTAGGTAPSAATTRAD